MEWKTRDWFSILNHAFLNSIIEKDNCGNKQPDQSAAQGAASKE